MKPRGSSGAVAIEFAIVGLAFISLLLLALETGWQLVTDSALGAGARAASRFGSTGTKIAAGVTPPPPDRNTSIEDLVIQNSGNLLLPDRLQITEASYASFAAVSGGGGTPGPGNASQVVQYTFTYTQPYLTPMAAAITGQQNLIHSVQVTVLNEPFPANWLACWTAAWSGGSRVCADGAVHHAADAGRHRSDNLHADQDACR